MLDDRWQDVRFALRTFTRAPGFTAAAVATLALGLGGTLAVFAVVHGVLLRPLPNEAGGRLVHIEGPRSALFGVTYAELEDLRERSRTLDGISAWQFWRMTLRDAEGRPDVVSGASVSASYFALLDARPQLGRLFAGDAAGAARERAVVLGHAEWQARFGGRTDIVGTTIIVDGEAHVIIGVVEPGFVDPVAHALGRAQPVAWRAEPPVFESARGDYGWIGFWAIARLRPGVTPAAATAEVNAIAADAARVRGTPDSAPVRSIAPFRERLVRDVRPTLLVLLAATGGVLLIACANLTSLLLSRATVRRREMAVRTSLGAGRRRLVGLLLTESFLVALAGAAAGLLVAWVGLRAVIGLAPDLPRLDGVRIDATIVAVGFGLCIAATLLAGLAPAFALTAPAVVLRGGGRGTIGGGRDERIRQALVVAETAMAVALLAGAGVLLSSAWNLMQVEPGFATDGAVVVRATLTQEVFPDPALQTAALGAMEARIAALPGVMHAGAISDLPMSGAINSTVVRRTDAMDDPAMPQALVRAVTPGWFDAVGVRLAAGRTFGPADGPGARDVAIVNAALAARLFVDGTALGRTVVVRDVTREIVGIAPDLTEFRLAGGPDPVLYLPYAQEAQPWMRVGMSIVARASGDVPGLAESVRAAAREAAPTAVVGVPRPLRALVDADLAAPRFRARLLGAFAALALALAAIGTGGLAAYAVARRLPELGLRLALGATPHGIARMVLTRTTLLALIGIALGLAAALAGLRALSGMLFGVAPADPLVLGASAALLLLASLAAAAAPARRAAALDPVTTLRAE